MSARLLSTQIIKRVIEKKQSLSNIFNDADLINKAGKEKALIQEICYGSIRWYIQLEKLLDNLIEKPIRKKDQELKYLIIIGLYQLIYMDIAPHAVVSETVETCSELNKKWAKGFVNAILRSYIRTPDRLKQLYGSDDIKTAHPVWFIETLKQDWPDNWANILETNNQRPPMYLRVNRLLQDRQSYLQILNKKNINASETPFSKNGILLEKPMDVSLLPGFKEGWVSVQELAAQFAAELLDLQSGHHVLDACAAPGGKSAHILETMPDITSLTALEKDEYRAQRLNETFKRLKLNATIKIADALSVEQWWDKQLYDRILLDAPCSASGVIRRNPDIKVLRGIEDVEHINKLQLSLLSTLWALLKSKGRLLYATCSILKQENSDTIKEFIKSRKDCVIRPISAAWGMDTGHGTQILTGENNMDGFFYALLEKK